MVASLSKFYDKIELFFVLRILTARKHCQLKLQRLQKVRIWAFSLLIYQINSLKGS